ncbi:MAG: acetyl-CoA carboxylase biotin carboxyl carrier protein subunit, partial [Planctomycetales bacterium]|nr:acetyl-CoA carboxylase biotin carboxyl carrier protein subunit [Planctomycetales bacterium]
KAPIAGLIVSLRVEEGHVVKAGTELLVLEAMKMENRIPAHMAGKVKSLHVSEGQSVLEGHVLLVLE